MGDLWSSLADPFAPVFMRRALVEALLLSIPVGLVGAWVVLRRLSFTTHAVGHATFPVLVVAYLLGWSVGATSLIAAIAVAVALGALGRLSPIANGAGVGVVLSTALAIGAVLVSDISDPGVSADRLLFGSVLGVSDLDMLATLAAAVPAIVICAGLAGPLAAATFDPVAAKAARIPVRSLDVLLMATLGAVVAVGLPVAGSLMISGLLLLPAAAARLLTTRLPRLLAASVAITAAESVVGLWLAVRFDAPPGACIALLGVAVLVAVATAQTAGNRLRRAHMTTVAN